MASSIRPKAVICRICRGRKALHSITIREGPHVVFYAACTQCRQDYDRTTRRPSATIYARSTKGTR